MCGIEFDIVHESGEAVKKAQEEQKEIIEKRKKIREKELLDYHQPELICDENDQIKKKKKMIGEIKRSLHKNYAFYYISRHVRKEERKSIKRMHAIDENQYIVKTHAEREVIE